jgi:hypothetical protein
MSGPKPTRDQGDLAEMLETLLDKGVVVNADIAVTVGDTDLLSVHVRAAVASFETAAAYGLEFPGGTDMERVRAAAGVDPLDDEARDREIPVDGTGADERDDAERTGEEPATAATGGDENDADAADTDAEGE